MRRLAFLFLLILAAPTALATAPGALTLPADSPFYEDLEHFRALGHWSGSLEIRPISRRQVARAVRMIERSTQDLDLARGDELRLDRLHAALEAWGLGERKGRTRDRRRPGSRWETGLALNFAGGPSNLKNTVDLYRRPRRDGAFFLNLTASVGRNLGAQWRWYEDYSAITPMPQDNWMDNLPPSARKILTDASSRNDLAVVSWAQGPVHLRLGREDRRWGQGRRGTLFLSENAFPMDGITFGFRSRWVSGASIMAQSWRAPNPPLADEPPGEEHLLGDGYYAAHRFELHPRDSWSLGVFEAVAYGGRGIDFAYLNPVGFFVAVTQDVWDRAGVDDKKVLGFDFRVRRAPVEIYGEFLINRVVTLDAADDGDESGITSLAQLIGLNWANPLGLAGADLKLEYAHLDPEVYFHPDGDSRRSLLSEGEVIGHWAGANSDVLFAAFRFPEFRAGLFRLEFEQARWGLVDGLTGNQFGFIGLTKAEQEWLVGDIVSERTVSLHWEQRDISFPLAGRADSRISLARVVRTGAWESAGWQMDARLTWHWGRVFLDGD